MATAEDEALCGGREAVGAEVAKMHRLKSDWSRNPLRIAFHTIGGSAWWGGLQYQANLVAAIRRFASDKLEPVIFAAPGVERAVQDVLEDALKRKLVIHETIGEARSGRRMALSALGVPNRKVVKLFKEYEIDVAFENAMIWAPDPGVGVVGWVPDLQHRLMPEKFSLSARWRREFGFRAQQRLGRKIMLSSVDAYNAYSKFYSYATSDVRVVPFAVPYRMPPSRSKSDETLRRYDIPSRFLLLPNQFWPHKNHSIIVEALGICKSRGVRIPIICTGNTVDSEGTETFDHVSKLVEQYELEAIFRPLGMVPYEHLQHLFHAAVAVLNPSECEGWNTSVEEAKSSGIPLLLSDIAVHREQATGYAEFVEPKNAVAWADVLCNCFTGYPDSTERRGNAELYIEDANNRQREFVNRFWELCVCATADYSSR